MNNSSHQELAQRYVALGGDPQAIKAYLIFTPRHYAKLSYLLKQLKTVPAEPESDVSVALKKPTTIDISADKKEDIGRDEIVKDSYPIPEKKKSIFSDLITQYPLELHPVYKQRYEYWLEACSLKMQLNELHYTEEDKAYTIQNKLIKVLELLDKCHKSLSYYQEFKRVLPLETKEDYSSLSPMELLTKRNNLRSGITKRKATILKMEKELPEPSHPDYKKHLHALNCKREQLQGCENILQQLNLLIHEV